MSEEKNDVARNFYNNLTDGLTLDTQSLAHRNSKAICLLLAELHAKGIMTDTTIDRLITEAKS